GRVIGGNKKRFLKKLHTANKTGEAVEIRAFPNSGMQNKELAKKLREYQERGVEYADMAVLFRTNSDARLLVEYLMEYNIPFRLKEALPDIYDHWISKDIITYIRIAMGSRARADFLKIINRPKRYISRECLDTQEFSFDRLISFYEEKRWMVERIERLEEDVNFMQDMPPYAAISYVRRAIGYEDFLNEYAQNKRINPEELFLVLDELQESAEGFQTAEEWFAHIEEYREEIKQQERQPQEEEQDAVVLSTLHGSKGLEYSVVFLTDVNEGVLPYKKAVLDEDIEEERRMLYVGMTRAKERLHIYYVKERYHKQMEPSRFLTEAGLIPIQEEK
ncbi:MAG: ATP-dependent helicase, partial [Lachnospiraceae bacterium]|nr:ATP-dependent helicase [Lachnospiraceae bacterium]